MFLKSFKPEFKKFVGNLSGFNVISTHTLHVPKTFIISDHESFKDLKTYTQQWWQEPSSLTSFSIKT